MGLPLGKAHGRNMKYPEDVAYSKLVDWCNKAERCRFDIVRKMKLWGADYSVIESHIARLQKSNLFNDERLKARGIPDESIKSALDILENETHQENIRELITRKWPSIKGKNDNDRKSKLIQFLMRKGFTYDSIRKELADAEFDADDFNHP